jgi:hypothetical protein
MAFTSGLGVDYGRPSCGGAFCDDPGAAIAALAHGHLGRFFDTQPTMGPLTLWLRAPFAALAGLGSDSTLSQYRLGAFACLLATGLIALWLAARAAERGASLLAQIVLVAVVLANPMVFRGLDLGHPEEALGAALAAAAIVAAAGAGGIGGSPSAAGVLLGLALATKQWALLAAGPVLIAAPTVDARRRIVVAALAVALVLAAPLAIGNTTRFVDANRDAVSPHADATPANVWWPLAVTVRDPTLAPGSERREPPDVVRRLSHLLVLALTAAASVFLLLRRPRRTLEAALALAAVAFLLRCLLDPYTFSYHHVPFLTLLAVYEVVGMRRLPVLAIVANVLLWYFTWHVASPLHPTRMNEVYVAGGVALLAVVTAFGIRETIAARNPAARSPVAE